MAVVNTFNKVPNDEEQQNAAQFVNKPVSVSGLSAAPAPTAAPVSAAAPTIGQGTSNNSNPTSSGRFTNLQNYLNANKDYNKSGGGLAGQMNTNFKNQATGIENDLTATRNQFNVNAEAGRAKTNDALMTQMFADPNAFIQNTANIDAFTKQRDATYTGPTTLDASGVTAKTNNLQSNTNLTNNESGRFALLNKMFGKQDYNSGSQKLDNLLLQGNSQQLGALQNSRTLPVGIANNVNTSVTQSQIDAQDNAREAQGIAANTRQQLSDNIVGYDTRAQELAGGNNKTQEDALALAQRNLSKNVISAADLKRFGLADNISLYPGIKPVDYITNTTPRATGQNVMSAAEYANLAALNKLSGSSNVLSTGANDVLRNYGNPVQASTYTGTNNPYGFNTDKFMTDLGGAAGRYDTELQDLLEKSFATAPTAGTQGIIDGQNRNPHNREMLANTLDVSRYNPAFWQRNMSDIAADNNLTGQQRFDKYLNVTQHYDNSLEDFIKKYGVDSDGQLHNNLTTTPEYSDTTFPTPVDNYATGVGQNPQTGMPNMFPTQSIEGISRPADPAMVARWEALRKTLG